ncbi:hypothetical protein JCM9279_007571 [Rhodotorula babjevae]
MDDELDPAFLDLDLHSPHASTSSLGADFGSTRVHDDLDSLDSHGHAHALDLDLDLEPDFGTVYGGVGLPSSLDGLPEQHTPPSTPPRRRGDSKLAVSGPGAAEGGGGGGLSLADELASAARPQRQRDLMRELGLGSDSGEDERDEERTTGGSSQGGYSSDQEEEDVRHGGSALGAGFGRTTAPAGSVVADPFTGSPRRSAASLGRSPRTRPSTSSLTSYTPGGSTPDELDAEADEAAQQDEVDAALREAEMSLEQSMQTTSAFLAHLRQHVTAEVDPHAAAPARTPLAAPIDEPLPPTASSSPAPALDYTDRQTVVEAHASTLVRRLYELAKQRESQLRELGEVERVLGRTEPGWRAALAELEPLDFSTDEGEDEVDERGKMNGADQEPPVEPSANGERPSSPRPLALDAPGPAPPPRSRPPPASSLALSRAHDDLAALRTLTTSLLSALSSISDLTQVQSALASDAGRKLRALKAQAGTLRDELGAVERSEAFVEAFEGRAEGRRTLGAGRAAESARREVEGVRETLEEGWRRAQSMLVVRV